jgi:upstream activation factor subunit UAF30
VKAEIQAELKKRKEEAAKPKASASGKPTWSTPAPTRPAAKKGKSDFMVPMQPSDQLAAITGAAPLARTEITKKIWGHIKRNGLQDKKNLRFIIIDEKLAPASSAPRRRRSRCSR